LARFLYEILIGFRILIGHVGPGATLSLEEVPAHFIRDALTYLRSSGVVAPIMGEQAQFERGRVDLPVIADAQSVLVALGFDVVFGDFSAVLFAHTWRRITVRCASFLWLLVELAITSIETQGATTHHTA
jgi:hypothetical protein